MIHKIAIHTGLLKRYALLASLLLLALALAACSKPAEEASEEPGQGEIAAPESKGATEAMEVEGEEPQGKGVVMQTTSLIPKSFQSIFDLLEYERQYQKNSRADEKIEQAISAKKQEILASAENKPVNENIDLVGFQYKKIEPGKYLARSAYYAKGDISDAYQVAYLLRIDKEHEKYFDQLPNPVLWMFWVFHNETKTSEWRKGNFCIVEKTIEFPDVPVNVQIVFLETHEKKIKFTVPLGWQAAVD